MLPLQSEILSKLFYESPTAIAISRKSDGVIIDVNKAYVNLFAFNSKEEMIGKTGAELNIMDSSERKRFLDLLQHKGEVTGHEIEMRDKQGHAKCVAAYMHPVILNNEDALLWVILDITDRKRAEENVNKLNEELQKNVSQLEFLNKELESFSYSVSHDLRAPLRIIDGYANIFEADYKKLLDEEGIRLLDIIRSNSKRMGELIEDLLRFSRLGRQELTPMPVDMNELVNQIIDEQKASLPATQFKIDKLPVALCDRQLMRHVWTNLISNAVKFSNKQPNPVVEIGSRNENNNQVFFIKDNGVGFDMQYAHKLFGTFQRLHKMDEFEGTGVGLAIVKRVVNKHGGEAWADAAENVGATFYFTLPLKATH